MMTGSLRFGKIADIEILIHVNWHILVVLLTLSLTIGCFSASVWMPYRTL
jgi:hypothetical protein